MKMFPLKSNERAELLLVRTRRAKSYRERRKMARAARKGSITGSGEYREKRHDGEQRNINTRLPIIIMSE